MSECGVLYIAFGPSFTEEAILSFQSLRRYMKDVPVCFMTDSLERLDRVEDENLIKKQIKPKHIRSKVDFIDQSPFEKTLYLDSDTLVAWDLFDVFESLDRFDVGVTHDYARKREKYSKVIPEYAKIPYSFSEVNGGVFAFRKNKRTDEFLAMWKKYFYKYFSKTSGWDQVSLRISLWESAVQLYHLPVEYNIRSQANRDKADLCHNEFGEDHLAPRIYHMHYNREVHFGKFNVKTVDELERLVIPQAIKF